MFYLNGDFTGGPTNFVQDQPLFRDPSGKIRARDGTVTAQVFPEPGLALVFNHGLLHEGGSLKSGQKYILRSEIMYERVHRLEMTEEETEAIALKRRAELLESEGQAMRAVEMYRKAFKLCPELERF
ncbi:hypothetical protein HDU67_006886 [Dinochytrium kinnereticum]|nr:hypothetical protein HDU67_006886 [Dinochytrium kinnereticum]